MSIDLEFFLQFIMGAVAMVATLVAWGYKVISSSQEARAQERDRALERRLQSLEAYFKSHFDRQADVQAEIHKIKVDLAKQQRTEGELGRQIAEVLAEIRRGR